jgi:chemotaxis-related protein WspD
VFGVDEIYGVYRAPQDSFSNVPTTISKATGTYTKAIIKWQDKNVICLDDDLVFYTINKRVL